MLAVEARRTSSKAGSGAPPDTSSRARGSRPATWITSPEIEIRAVVVGAFMDAIRRVRCTGRRTRSGPAPPSGGPRGCPAPASRTGRAAGRRPPSGWPSPVRAGQIRGRSGPSKVHPGLPDDAARRPAHPALADRADALLDAFLVGEPPAAHAALASLVAIDAGGRGRVGGDQHHLGLGLRRAVAAREEAVAGDFAEVEV